MSISKGKTVHVKLPGKGHNCEWITIKAGEEIPERILGQYLQQGGQLLEEVKNEDKEEILNRVKEFEADLKDDGKRNYSNNPKKKSPGRKKSKKW